MNTLEVVGGDFEPIRKFLLKEDEYSHVLDFQKITPMPEELRSTTSPVPETASEAALMDKYGFDNWYDWAYANWGTKWNSYDGHLNEQSVSFCTAWGPPLPVIERLAQITGLTLRLTYSEDGMCFCGEFIAGPDGIVKNVSYDYDNVPEDLRDELNLPDEEEEIDE